MSWINLYDFVKGTSESGMSLWIKSGADSGWFYFFVFWNKSKISLSVAKCNTFWPLKVNLRVSKVDLFCKKGVLGSCKVVGLGSWHGSFIIFDFGIVMVSLVSLSGSVIDFWYLCSNWPLWCDLEGDCLIALNFRLWCVLDFDKVLNMSSLMVKFCEILLMC